MLAKPSKALLTDLFNKGLSSRQIAAQVGLSKSYAYKLLKGLGLSRSRREAAILRQPFKSKHWRSSRQAARKIWARAYGPIPKGYHIHHKDQDFTNNSLDNLECMDGGAHTSLHNRGPDYGIPRHLRPARRAYMQQWFSKHPGYHAQRRRMRKEDALAQ